MVFMNARKRNKTITLVIVGFLSVGLLLSVSLYWQNTGNVSATGTGAGTAVAGSPEATAALKDFNEGFNLMQQSKTADAQKKFESAIKGFEKALVKNPNDYQVLGDLATAYYYTGNVDKAIESVKKALEISPNFTPARMNYAIYLGYGKNNVKDAIAELNKIPKGDQNYSSAQEIIAELNSKSVPETSAGTGNGSATGSGAVSESGEATGNLPTGHPSVNDQGEQQQQVQPKEQQSSQQSSQQSEDELVLPGITKSSSHP